MKIRKGDKVKILSGKQTYRGLEAEVLKVFKDKNKILVKGVNLVTKHLKKMGSNPGQIVKIEKPIDISNVMLMCPFTNKPTRIGYVFLEEKGKTKKFRYSKRAVLENKGEPKKYIINNNI